MRLLRDGLIAACFAGLLTGFPLRSYATVEKLQPSPWVQEPTYVEKTVGKLGFGILNGITGWTALLFEPYRYNNVFTGVVKGAWRTVTNTVGGVLHIGTFPFPFDIPLPDGGVHFD